jgi:hypothetical protein
LRAIEPTTDVIVNIDVGGDGDGDALPWARMHFTDGTDLAPPALGFHAR